MHIQGVCTYRVCTVPVLPTIFVGEGNTVTVDGMDGVVGRTAVSVAINIGIDVSIGLGDDPIGLGDVVMITAKLAEGSMTTACAVRKQLALNCAQYNSSYS